MNLALVFALLHPAFEPRQALQIEDGIRGLEQAIEEADGTAADRDSLAYLSNVPLARLKVRKARAYAEAIFLQADEARKEIAEGFEALDRLREGRIAFEGETGHLERAYIARTDDTAQPYYLYVPENYDPAERWPLIVFLHGYVTYTELTVPWVLAEDKERVAARNDAILLTPYGRRNTDFQGVGEVDVLRAMEETRRFYSIDPDRIYLAGPSMGGYGTWTISLRYPGIFAACAPMCGQTDMFVWWPWPHVTAPKFKQFLGEWDNPIDLAPNALGQAYFLQHGEFDTLIPIEQSYMMMWELEQLGTPIDDYFEHPGADHLIYTDLPCYQRAFPWLVQHELDRWPKHVRLRSYSYRYDTAFWVRILEYRQWGRPGFVEARVDADANRIDLTTENVAQISIALSDQLLDLKRPVTVVADGNEVFSGSTKGSALSLEIAEPLTPPKAGTVRKRKGLCGPVEDVFNGPFVVVPGTSGTEAETRDLAEKAERWRDEWDDFADGTPPLMLDVDVDDKVMASRNLVLFGTPGTNRVVGLLAEKLPVRIGDHEYAIGGHTFDGPETGLVLCYPNPMHPDRYILVYAGEYQGRKLGINHKHDLLPDYFIFSTDASFTHDGMDRHLCAGFFDLNWEFDPDLADFDGEVAEEYFGSAGIIRDRGLREPVLWVTNGYHDPLRFVLDEGGEERIPPGETLELRVEAGRHRLTGRCPDGTTRVTQRLMVPGFAYAWSVPPLLRPAWP
jgi:pimeloyl-ACP methyl ester carboxylesterase